MPPRRILITGGTGTLGRHAVLAVERRPGLVARVLSRGERPADLPAGREWVRARLGEDDLAPAVEGADAILHLASAKAPGDAEAALVRRLLAAARAAAVRHAVLISIVGCDRIPLPFYAAKVRAEEAVRSAGVPWSIVRVSQFHSFVERLVASLGSLPIPVPIAADLRFQPVDEAEAAEHLVEVALGPPLGDAPELAGPELLTLGEIAAAWLEATGRPATLLPVPSSALGGPGGGLAPAAWAGAVLEGYREARNAPRGGRALGRVRFSEWLRRR